MHYCFMPTVIFILFLLCAVWRISGLNTLALYEKNMIPNAQNFPRVPSLMFNDFLIMLLLNIY